VKPQKTGAKEDKMRRAKLTLFILCLTATAIAAGQTSQGKKLTAAEAKDHIGDRATVCGMVASTHYAASSRGRPTFLTLDAAFPKQVFTILIWGSDRPKFGDPEAKYRDKQICVTGLIKDYRGVPEIVASDPEQIKEEPKGQK
jgi:micrococcal nuclease